MGSCCSSKKTKFDPSVYADLQVEAEPESTLDPTAILKQLQNSQKLSEKDELFEEYVNKHLESPQDHMDQTGQLNFDYFIKVYKTALIWNRVKFAEKKVELIAMRRKALAMGDMLKYREIHQAITDADEICLQDVLEEILLKIGMTDKEFQKSLNYHMDDKTKTPEIRQALEDAQVDRGGGKRDHKESRGSKSREEGFAAQKATPGSPFA